MEEFALEEDDMITSICMSRDGKYLLANVSQKQPTLCLWDLRRRERMQKYRGHKQDLHVIRPSFGGTNQSLVAAGSEDMNVYIWHKEKGDILAKVSGHSAIVNAVDWCPSNHMLMASASDDRSVRLWGPEGMHVSYVSDPSMVLRVDEFNPTLNRNGARQNHFPDIGEEDEEGEDEDEDLDDSYSDR